jgi:hypothetical protein
VSKFEVTGFSSLLAGDLPAWNLRKPWPTVRGATRAATLLNRSDPDTGDTAVLEVCATLAARD